MHVDATRNFNPLGFQKAQSTTLQSRLQSSGAASDPPVSSSETPAFRVKDSVLDEKLADFSRIQSAFLAALRIGEDIQNKSLLAVIR